MNVDIVLHWSFITLVRLTAPAYLDPCSVEGKYGDFLTVMEVNRHLKRKLPSEDLCLALNQEHLKVVINSIDAQLCAWLKSFLLARLWHRRRHRLDDLVNH